MNNSKLFFDKLKVTLNGAAKNLKIEKIDFAKFHKKNKMIKKKKNEIKKIISINMLL